MGALDRVFRGRRGGQERPVAAIVAGLWKNGEQGVWYDPSDFDRYMAMVGPSQTPAVASVFGESVVVSPGVYRIYSTGAFSAVNGISTATATIGEKYEVRFTVDSITTLGSGLVIESVENPSVTTLGPQRLIVTATNTNMFIKRGAACDIQISAISVKQWLGRNEVSLFQDAAGTTPVVALEQPVGLILDKRLGLVRGPERVINGDFSAGATSWILAGADATHIATFAGGTLRYQSDTMSPQLVVAQLSALVIGRWYEVTFVISAWVSGTIKAEGLSVIPPVSGVGTYTHRGTALAPTLSITRSSANVDVTIDSISVKELFGNHAYQATTTSRPTLSARYNLLTNTENATAWTKTQGDTGVLPVVTPDAALAPNGTLSADRCVMSRGLGATNAAFSLMFLSASHTSATVSVRSIWMRSFTGENQAVLLYDGSQTVGRVVTVTPQWQQFFLTGGNAAVGSSLVVGTRGGDPGTYYASGGDPNLDILVWGMDVRAANDGVGLPPYQRVVDAANYDTAGFPRYLKFDGVDDFLQTAAVDFSGTDKLFATAALRKLSDSVAGIVVELSAVSNTSNGSFALLAPAGANDTLAVYMRGATALTTSVPSGIPSPTSRVFTGVMDLSAAVGKQSQSRVNGARYAYASQDSGGGNFGVYPLYIGRRGGTGLPLNGRIYGLVIRSNFASEAQLAAVERHLNQKARIY